MSGETYEDTNVLDSQAQERAATEALNAPTLRAFPGSRIHSMPVPAPNPVGSTSAAGVQNRASSQPVNLGKKGRKQSSKGVSSQPNVTGTVPIASAVRGTPRNVDDAEHAAVQSDGGEDSEDEGECEGLGRDRRWEDWETKLLIEVKKKKSMTIKRKRAPYAFMSRDERKDAGLDPDFDKNWIDLLESLLCQRSCQNPPMVADSSAHAAGASNLDDSDVPLHAEARIFRKRKRPDGKNTKFLVTTSHPE
ncbi:hypothetical protein R1sor_005568 [Riccia sorocarpa]|uniref:Uncharacterized protein n=1 Tax=Riccia sorocarpa TaxID=122646 RepID=A0ABD3HNH2_9MARC